MLKPFQASIRRKLEQDFWSSIGKIRVDEGLPELEDILLSSLQVRERCWSALCQ